MRKVLVAIRKAGDQPATGEDTDLGTVFRLFFAEKVPTYTDRWQKACETRRALFEEAWGTRKPVALLSETDVEAFVHLRRTGKLAPEGSEGGARDGTIEADIRWLSTVFRWAKRRKVTGSRTLIASNPLEDVKRPQEKNPRRPIASHDRYVRTVAKADEVDPEGRLRCMLALARFTGRRESSICQLRAEMTC